MRVLLRIAYDGTAYHGWQQQENAISIQEEVQKALSELMNRDISVTGASRTDAGVHALGNVAVFDCDTTIPPDRIMYALNERLPEDIRIMHSEAVRDDFNPRYDALSKTYVYSLCDAHIMPPTQRLYCYYVKHTLNVKDMQTAAGYFVGEHDFTSVSSVHAQTDNYIRTIYLCRVERRSDKVLISVNGSGFLYNMVRIISGTLLSVGIGKTAPKQIEDIIKAKDRTLAGPTLPACGLMLKEIFYE